MSVGCGFPLQAPYLIGCKRQKKPAQPPGFLFKQTESLLLSRLGSSWLGAHLAFPPSQLLPGLLVALFLSHLAFGGSLCISQRENGPPPARFRCPITEESRCWVCPGVRRPCSLHSGPVASCPWRFSCIRRGHQKQPQLRVSYLHLSPC